MAYLRLRGRFFVLDPVELVEVEGEPVQLITPRREPSLVVQLALTAHKLAHVIGNVEGCRGRATVFQVDEDDLEKIVHFLCHVAQPFLWV